MSENSSITVDQTQRRQNGNGRGRQVILLANMPPLSPPTARRTIIIQNRSDIVSVLSYVSRSSRQALYVLSGRGYVSQSTLLLVPSRETLMGIGRGNILYMSGWFQPAISTGGIIIPSSCANGVLHVSLSAGVLNIAIANSLIAAGPIEVDVIFICGPGSTFQPDAPGGPREPIRLRIQYAQQAPVA